MASLVERLVVVWITTCLLFVPANTAGMAMQAGLLRLGETSLPLPSEQQMQQALQNLIYQYPSIEQQATNLFNSWLNTITGNPKAILFLPFIADYPGVEKDLFDDSQIIVDKAIETGYFVVVLKDSMCTRANYIVFQLAVLWLGAALGKPVVQLMQMHGNVFGIAPWDAYLGFGECWNLLSCFWWMDADLIFWTSLLTGKPPIYVLFSGCCEFLGAPFLPIPLSTLIGYKYLFFGWASVVCGWFGLGVSPCLCYAFNYATSPISKPVGTAWIESQKKFNGVNNGANIYGGIPTVMAMVLNPFSYTLPS